MSNPRNDLLDRIEEIKSVLRALDQCLENVVSAENRIQAHLRFIPRFDRYEDRIRAIRSRAHKTFAGRYSALTTRAAPRFN